MTLFQNGRIPLDKLLLLDHGVDENGYWEHRLSAATTMRLRNAQAYAQRKWGRAPKIKHGWNGYRPFAVQADARVRACNEGDCNAAASAGWSSHGGTWIDTVFTGGRWVDALAIDIDPNGLSWAQVDEAMQQAGFLIHGITIARAGRSEPWHYIDLHCWDAIPADVNVTDFPIITDITTPPQGGTDMYAIKVDGDAARGPVELVAGFLPSKLSDEEFKNYTGGTATSINARQYDLALSRWGRLVERVPLVLAKSPNRAWALFAPGYMFQFATDEQRQNIPWATSIQVQQVNDRQWDLYAEQATSGKAAAGGEAVAAPTVDATVLAQAVGSSVGDVVKAEFAGLVLKASS